jgi:hypothetical protein
MSAISPRERPRPLIRHRLQDGEELLRLAEKKVHVRQE